MSFIYGFLVLVLAHSCYSFTPAVRYCGRVPGGLKETAAAYDGKDSIYTIGGTIDRATYEPYFPVAIQTDAIGKYNINDGSYEVVGNLPEAAMLGYATMLDEDIIYITESKRWGASDSDPNFSKVLRIRFGNDGKVSEIIHERNLTNPRWRFGATRIEETVYIFGGDLEENSFFSRRNATVEAYNLKTNDSNIVAGLIQYADELTYLSVAAAGNYIYLFGGEGAVDSVMHTFDTIIRFAPRTGKLELMGETLSTKTALSSAIGVGNDVYVLDAENYNQDLKCMQKYEPEVNIINTADVQFPYWLGRVSSPVYVQVKNTVYVFAGGEVAACYNTPLTSEILCIDMPVAKFDCKGRADGNYAHPSECSKFIACLGEQVHEFNCPDGLHFYPKLQVCYKPDPAICG